MTFIFCSGMCTNEVWTTGTEQIEWQSSLPPMRSSRCSSSAINAQLKQSQTECIVVAGGYNHGPLNTVEVFVQGEWSVVQPLPHKYFSLQYTIHDGILYLIKEQDKSVFYCKLDSLLSSLSNDTLWKTSQVPLYSSSYMTFHRHLLSLGGYFLSPNPQFTLPSSDIHAYSPITQSWQLVGNLPVKGTTTSSTVIPTGILVISGYKVFKASLIGENLSERVVALYVGMYRIAIHLICEIPLSYPLRLVKSF